VVDAGIAAAAAGPLVTSSFDHHDLDAALGARRVHVIAAGKAAAPMVAAFVARCRAPLGAVVAVGSHRHLALPSSVAWHETGHPTPDARSVAAGRRALETARAVAADEMLVILLSGGASALLACPLDGITLDDKQHTGRLLMAAGADITALNTVRKHLSALKGGRLAAACQGQTLTLAVSDVVGDDLSVIGSGPGVPDATTWRDALAMLARYGGLAHHRPVVVDVCERGARGEIQDTPGPGDPALARSRAVLIGGAAQAVAGARHAAASRGYHVIVEETPVTGEAREAAVSWLAAARRAAAPAPRPVCVLSTGETTVTVTGQGRGGRNQEFVLALARLAAEAGEALVAGSAGTDGIDGPTDAAGAIVDPTTLARAEAAGLPLPEHVLADNDSYRYFAGLGDLLQPGRTDTNVGDLQVMLIG